MIPPDVNVNFDLGATLGLSDKAEPLRSVRQFQKGDLFMLTIIQALLVIIGVVRFFVIAHFIMSWLIRFEVLNVRQQFVGQVWYTLERVLDPIYGPVRRMMPNMGGIDLAPVIVLVGLEILRIFLINNIGAFV
ncbi:YGGT family protein [Yoonia vestfoldensis SKA53]|uniref:YGGT family protein n=2 Tax=Paracoccaceae TaxID=31989 RepID=A3V1R9_9RHOB|nr:YGGT family protein [Yoonia vestfoldensis SKA53]